MYCISKSKAMAMLVAGSGVGALIAALTVATVGHLFPTVATVDAVSFAPTPLPATNIP